MAPTKPTVKPAGWYMPPDWSRRLGYALSAPHFLQVVDGDLFRGVFVDRVKHTDSFDELSAEDQGHVLVAEAELERLSGQPNPWANA